MRCACTAFCTRRVGSQLRRTLSVHTAEWVSWDHWDHHGQIGWETWIYELKHGTGHHPGRAETHAASGMEITNFPYLRYLVPCGWLYHIDKKSKECTIFDGFQLHRCLIKQPMGKHLNGYCEAKAVVKQHVNLLSTHRVNWSWSWLDL